MASNSFGSIFQITTWGESHGPAIGVVIDGCPAGLALTAAEINQALLQRAPGRNAYTSPRREPDQAELYSGVFDGKTTGAPISIIIQNHDADPSKYEPIKNLLRPGHANYTYHEKYGCVDHRGGGRASARETACRVAAGAIAKKVLQHVGIEVNAYLQQLATITATAPVLTASELRDKIISSPIFCPDLAAETLMLQEIETVKAAGDSTGGAVAFTATGLPVGLGDPVYDKLEAKLAQAMLSIPASKGFEMGSGFPAVGMRGSEHNDAFIAVDNIQTNTNHAGGTLGGISSGMPVFGRVAFKPTSSIQQPQQTVDFSGQPQTITLPAGSRHDPCVAIRAVPVVEAMCALVLVDAWLLNRCVKLEG